MGRWRVYPYNDTNKALIPQAGEIMVISGAQASFGANVEVVGDGVSTVDQLLAVYTKVIGIYDPDRKYQYREICIYQGVIYRSSFGGNNLDNEPSTSPSYWVDISATSTTTTVIDAWSSAGLIDRIAILNIVCTAVVLIDLTQSAASRPVGMILSAMNTGTSSVNVKYAASVTAALPVGETIMIIWNGTTWLDLTAPKIGYVYVQGANDASPSSLWPLTTWTDVSSEEAGRFRRTKGTYSPPNGGSMGMSTVGATQDHAGQSHVHLNGVGTSDLLIEVYGSATVGAPGSSTRNVQTSSTIPTGQGYVSAPIASAHGTPQLDYETRPAAVCVAKWRRTV